MLVCQLIYRRQGRPVVPLLTNTVVAKLRANYSEITENLLEAGVLIFDGRNDGGAFYGPTNCHDKVRAVIPARMYL